MTKERIMKASTKDAVKQKIREVKGRVPRRLP